MNRRTVIRTLGIGGLVGIAGCAALRDGSDGGDRAGEETEHADLSIAAVNSEWTSPTRMMAEIAVANDGGVRGSATLYFEVDVDVGGTYTKSEHISVPPGDRTTHTFGVEIDPSESMGAERADTRAWLE